MKQLVDTSNSVTITKNVKEAILVKTNVNVAHKPQTTAIIATVANW